VGGGASLSSTQNGNAARSKTKLFTPSTTLIYSQALHVQQQDRGTMRIPIDNGDEDSRGGLKTPQLSPCALK